MAWTTKQIYDLDNSMVAAQNVSLGTFLSGVASNLVVSGSFTPAAASTPIATGLTTVSNVVVSMSGSPTEKHMWTTATAGSVAGTIVVSCWQPTNASTVTPIASTGSYVAVRWVAVGA